jgi:hypothetical protein
MFRKLSVAFCLSLSICSPLRGADSARPRLRRATHPQFDQDSTE